MGESEETTQELQNKVDKIKTISLISNPHSLSPPIKKEEDNQNQVVIINALSSEPRLLNIFLEARGLAYDSVTKQFIQMSRPLLNIYGAWKLVAECKKIAQEAEFGNFTEEFIPAYVDHFFRSIYPYFTFWHEEYELNPRDFDYVQVTLQMFILSSFYKGKGGKYINVVGKTYDEGFMGKIMQGNQHTQKRESFLERYNPFKKIE